jgi:prepilin-type N-terminal cleavage/methylation domain-containing protein
LKPPPIAHRRRQAGYTLIELMIATSIGLIVMGALTSVVLTTALGANVATSRVEAAAQVRNFQLTAYDDFALSRPPATAGCGTQALPCQTEEMVLRGDRMPNQVTGVAAPYTVRYLWDRARQVITRTVDVTSRVAASNVTAYSWYIDSSGDHPSVVINMTVTVAFYNTQYRESQTLRFYPRISSP